MELLIQNITSKKDTNLLMELVKRLGFSAKVLSYEEKEDIALGEAIKEGRKGEYVDRETVMNALRK